MGYMIDCESLGCYGTSGGRADCSAEIVPFLARFHSQPAATSGKKADCVCACEQNPIELAERENRSIQLGGIGRLGKTDRRKEQDSRAHVFQARQQIARLLDGACDNDALAFEGPGRTHARVPRLSRSNKAAAPPWRNFWATLLPMASASSSRPESFSHMRCEPSGDNTTTSRYRLPSSIRPQAPIGIWQPPPRPARAERSAVTAPRLSASSSFAKTRNVSASPERASMPIAPWPAAGRLTSGGSTSLMFPLKPKRSSPALASTIAS